MFNHELNQNEFSKMLVTSYPILSNWLNGAKAISRKKLARVSHVTGMAVDELLGKEPSKDSTENTVNKNPNVAQFTFENGKDCYLFKDSIKGFWQGEEKGSYLFFGYKECVHVQESVEEVGRILNV